MVTSDLAAQRIPFADLLGLEVLAEENGYFRIGGGGGFHLGIEEGPTHPSDDLELTV